MTEGQTIPERQQSWSRRAQQTPPCTAGAAASRSLGAGMAALCLTPGWYSGVSRPSHPGRGLLSEQAEGGEREKRRGSTIPPLPEPRARLAPAAPAEEEDEAWASLQKLQLLPPSLPPWQQEQKRLCQQHPLSWGSFSWREWPSPGPSALLRKVQTESFRHVWASAVITSPHPHLPANRFAHECCRSPREERVRSSSACCLLGKAHLFLAPQGRKRLCAFQQPLQDQFDMLIVKP